MSDKKDFVDFVDFQKMVDELEKISFDANLGSIRTNFSKMAEMAEIEAEEDLSIIFQNSVKEGLHTLDKVPKPLTEKEARAFDQKYKEALEEVDLIKRKIAGAKKLLKKEVDREKGFDMSLKSRGKIRKVAKRFYGKNKDSISYEDYLEAREVRDSFNKKESLSFFKDEDE